jgi:hypothetical protein
MPTPYDEDHYESWIADIDLALTPLGESVPVFAERELVSAKEFELSDEEAVTAIGLDKSGSVVKVKTADGREGWCSLNKLVPHVARDTPWLRVAQSQVGTSEANNGSQVQAYIKSVTSPTKNNPDWCACFINWCMVQSKQPRANHANAQRWRCWGDARASSPEEHGLPLNAAIGDIAIGQRDSPASDRGHIAIFIGYSRGFLLLLGGNQPFDARTKGAPKSVRYSWYPIYNANPFGRLLYLRHNPKHSTCV